VDFTKLRSRRKARISFPSAGISKPSGNAGPSLSPKGLQFLELLLENRPRALSKSEIHEKLWPGTFVSDGTLTSLLAEVRSAIEDEAHEPRFVRTVHRFGYACSGIVEEVPPRRPKTPRASGSRGMGESWGGGTSLLRSPLSRGGGPAARG
jgi:Transcriptional regulatory protein, C terminal